VQLNLKYDPVLAKDVDVSTAWHVAAGFVYSEILKKCGVGVLKCK